MKDLNKETQVKENNDEVIGHMIDGFEITKDHGLEDYFHQICCVFTWLGEVTLSKIQDADRNPGYTYDAIFGHYLAFEMAMRELKRFGGFVGCHTTSADECE